MISAELRRHWEAIRICAENDCMVALGIPAALLSTANGREHRFVKAKRMKALRTAAHLRIRSWLRKSDPAVAGMAFVILVIRCAPKKHGVMDRDNLENAAKPVRDGIADAFGCDDSDPRIRFVVDQIVTSGGAPFVALEIFLS